MARRNRKQQQQVTRLHHVRSLPNATKGELKQRRAARALPQKVVDAAYAEYAAGATLQQLGNRYWEEWGCSTPAAAAQLIRKRLRESGYFLRGPIRVREKELTGARAPIRTRTVRRSPRELARADRERQEAIENACRNPDLADLVREQTLDISRGSRIPGRPELISLDALVWEENDLSRADALAVRYARRRGDFHTDAPWVPALIERIDRERGHLKGEDVQAGRRNIPRPQRWTQQAIISHIRAWVKEHGEPPGSQEWNAPNGRGIPSSASLVRHFGTFDNAIRAAGFTPRGRGGCKKQLETVPRGRRQRIRKQKRTSRMTSDDLAAAYALYDRQAMSTVELAERLWERFGYPSPNACKDALARGFHAEGFRLRTKAEARMCLSLEKRQEIARRMHEGRRAKAA